MRAYNLFNKIQNSSLLSFIICSVFTVIAEILSLIAHKLNGGLSVCINDFSSILINVIPYVFCYFIIQYFTTDKRWFKSFWGVLCLLLFSTAYGSSISFIIGILTALFCAFFFEKFSAFVSLPITVVCSVIFGLCFKYISDAANNLQMNVAYSISGKGIITAVLFGVISAALSLFGNNSFADLFFYKSYGGTAIINDELVTGIKDLVAGGYNGELVSELLTGHYFLLFALAGIAFSLADELKSTQKVCLIIVAVSAVISGNIQLLILFIFLEGWHMYFSIMLMSALSFIAANLLKIQSAYLFSGSIIELFANIDKPVYLIFTGLVFVAIGFFTAKYSCLKFGISDSLNTYVPSRLNKLVNSLGGIVNIIKITDDIVEVRNPKLINNFEIDCEIKGNSVKINDEKIEELKEYIQ